MILVVLSIFARLITVFTNANDNLISARHIHCEFEAYLLRLVNY